MVPCIMILIGDLNWNDSHGEDGEEVNVKYTERIGLRKSPKGNG